MARRDLYCLQARLNTEPEEPQWFCPDCQARVSPPSTPVSPSSNSTSSLDDSEDLTQSMSRVSETEEEERPEQRQTRSRFSDGENPPIRRIVEDIVSVMVNTVSYCLR